MKFSVNVNALYGLPAMLVRRQHDFAVGRAYLRESTHLRWGGGLINDLTHAHERTTQEIDAFLARAGDTYLRGYATLIHGADDSYRQSDGNAAAQLDATLVAKVYPSVTDRAADPGAGPEIFAIGENNFTAGYVPPRDYSTSHPYEPSWSGLITRGGLIRTALYECSRLAHHFGLGPARDPFEELCAPLVGDWAGVMASADAFTCIASVLAAERAQIRRGADVLWRVWTGNAAGNAEDALTRFATDLQPAEDGLVRIAMGYQRVAEGIQANSDAMATALGAMIDLALAVVATVATDGLFLASELEGLLAEFVELFDSAVRIISGSYELVRSATDYTNTEADKLGALIDAHYAPTLPDDMPNLPQPVGHR